MTALADFAAVGELPSGTITFLLTDVEGSTRAWETDEAAMREAMARHEQIFDDAISKHGGARPREQGEGDSVVAAFVRASDALSAALDTQLAFEGTPLRVRMGLHTGEADIAEGTGYSGPAIIRAARLRSLAHGGQVLVSRATADLVADRLPPDAGLMDLGSHRLKGLNRPEQVFQLTHPRLQASFPALASSATTPSNLPVELSSFVGRDPELADVSRLLAASRLVTLTGAGGCGKTRLAAHAAAAQTDAFPDGVWWIELGAVAEPEAVDQAVAKVIGVPEQRGRSHLDVVTEHLVGRRALVILDNCEHLLDACATWASTLVAHCPDLTVLATSREALGVGGEVAWRVPSMSVAGAEGDAVQLFVERARAVRPNFTLDAGNAPVITEICRRLDGMPLAIELAAARVRMLTPDQIAAALTDRFRILAGGARTAVRRQQTLRASVEWSYALLSGDEAALLRRLAVFAGGFTLDAAEAVCSGDGIDVYAVLDVLSRLADKSLVAVDDHGREIRYRLPETIRQYAGERLLEAGETEVYRDRHLEHYVAIAEAERGIDADHDAWLARIGADHDNLEAALEWALGGSDPDLAVRLTVALTPFWLARGRFRQGRRWAERVLDSVGPDDPRRGWALWPRAALGGIGGDMHAIESFGGDALALARTAGDDSLAARCLNLLALARSWSSPAAARDLLAESRALAERAGDGYALAESLLMTGWAWSYETDRAGAQAAALELAEVAARRRDSESAAMGKFGLVIAEVRGGDIVTARRIMAEAEALGVTENPMFRAVSVVTEADVQLMAGDYQQVRPFLEDSLELVKQSGAGSMTIHVVSQLAFVYLALGEPGRARSLVEKYLGAFRDQGATYSVMISLVPLGLALFLEGDFDGGAAALEEARIEAERFPNRWIQGLACQFLGFLALARGDLARSETLHHEALSLRLSAQYWPMVIESLEDLAGLALNQGSLHEATRLWAAAAAARSSLRYPRRTGMETLAEMAMSSCREALGDSDFEAAWKEGSELSLEEAVAYATRARGERKRPVAGWESLTPTEVKVVQAVRDGLTNPEIGARLFMSRSTVKTHLGHVFAKLGVTSRSELAAEAVRRNL